ncbi:MAG: hypothetical protein GY774_02035 [Planctomycetes bacterium]|nr:hypothetical protein [Planctomycetota bacterium]
MTENNQNLRQLYIDGQLTEHDRVEYEKQLSDHQRKEVEAERKFDGVILKFIKSKQEECPDKLWEDLKSKLEDKADAATSARIIPVIKRPLAYVACAIVLFVLIFALTVPKSTVAEQVEIQVNFPKDTTAFTEEAVIKGNQQDIQKTLNDEGFVIDISDIQECNQKHQHFVKIIGFSSVEIEDVKHPCAHLYFTCCGQPVSTYIVDKSRQSQEYKFSSPMPEVKRSDKAIKNYRIVTFSPHHTETVSGLFRSVESEK